MGLSRVLLALSVVLGHLGGIGGYSLAGSLAAAQMFFIISGFYRETAPREKYGPRADLGVFHASRALRIYSVYFACLVCSARTLMDAQANRSRARATRANDLTHALTRRRPAKGFVFGEAKPRRAAEVFGAPLLPV